MAKSNLRASAIYVAGLMARGLGYPELASRALGKAVALSPGNAVFHCELGVAQSKGHLADEAETSFRRALELKPDLAAAYSGLGDLFRMREKADDAVAQYEKALSLDPDCTQAHLGIGLIRFEQYRLDEAGKHLRRAAELDPGLAQASERLDEIIEFQKNLKDEIEKAIQDVRESRTLGDPRGLGQNLYRAVEAGMRDWALARAAEWVHETPENPLATYTLTALEGKTSPPAPPEGYVEELFDKFAQTYNRNLKGLSYQGPDLINRMLAGHFPGRDLDVLDLGCGTGLDAAALKPYARTLTGVDKSAKMLEIAKERGLYDDLCKSDIVSFLNDHPNSYDLIAASDVFCYFGDLTDVIGAMAKSLRLNGRVVFTLEHDTNGSGAGWRLQANKRYCHTGDYARGKVADAGLTVVAIDPGFLRQELRRNVEAIVVLAQKER